MKINDGLLTRKSKIFLEDDDYKRLRYAAMTGRFSYEYVRHESGEVEFDVKKSAVAAERKVFYRALEKVIDFGAITAAEAFNDNLWD